MRQRWAGARPAPISRTRPRATPSRGRPDQGGASAREPHPGAGLASIRDQPGVLQPDRAGAQQPHARLPHPHCRRDRRRATGGGSQRAGCCSSAGHSRRGSSWRMNQFRWSPLCPWSRVQWLVPVGSVAQQWPCPRSVLTGGPPSVRRGAGPAPGRPRRIPRPRCCRGGTPRCGGGPAGMCLLWPCPSGTGRRYRMPRHQLLIRLVSTPPDR